jgi:hypothetical protein
VYKPLSPCPGCARHVLASERACPFCHAAMPEDFSSRVRPEAPRRLSRAAVIALGTSLALAGCGDTVTASDAAPTTDASVDASRDVVSDEGGVVPLYGDPPPRDVVTDLVDDDGAPVAEYGAPPPLDAGTSDASSAGMYGAPPPRDAARDVADDEGGAMFLYGAPPPPPPPDGGP